MAHLIDKFCLAYLEISPQQKMRLASVFLASSSYIGSVYWQLVLRRKSDVTVTQQTFTEVRRFKEKFKMNLIERIRNLKCNIELMSINLTI